MRKGLSNKHETVNYFVSGRPSDPDDGVNLMGAVFQSGRVMNEDFRNVIRCGERRRCCVGRNRLFFEQRKKEVLVSKYDVHLFAVTRVKVKNVEAESQSEAVRKAQEEVDLHRVLDRQVCNCEQLHDGPCDHAPHVEHIEWAEAVKEALVDEAGDEEFERSTWYDPDGNPVAMEV